MFLSGIDIGGTSIKFGIFDEQLNLLQQWSRPTPKEPAEAAALIAAQLEPYHVAAIGAGAPGTLNAARETITAGDSPPAMRINAVAEAYCSKQPHWPQGQGRPSLWVMICPSSGASPVGLRQHCPLMNS